MSLSFLFCKPWHPATTWNQKKIWEAEQKDAKTKKDEAEARKELEKDAERRRYEHLAGGKGVQDASSAALNFMYAPPPGFQQPEEADINEDDEEVKKFKALAKMKSDPNFSAATSCSELEKLVGRRKNPGVSLAEQQERFPFLKDAPVEHAYAAGVKVNFKPFNNVIRHVRCMRCGEWGHRSGDRECKVNENPNDVERRLREDPMSHMGAASGGAGPWAAGAPDGAPPEGSNSGDDPNGDPDSAFLSTLSSKKKRRLLRLLQEMEAGPKEGEGEGGGKGERKRKRKDRRGSHSRGSKEGGSGKRKKSDGRRGEKEKGEAPRDERKRKCGGKERETEGPRHPTPSPEARVKRRQPPRGEEDSEDHEGRNSRERKSSKKSRRADNERERGSTRKRGSSHERKSKKDRKGSGSRSGRGSNVGSGERERGSRRREGSGDDG